VVAFRASAAAPGQVCCGTPPGQGRRLIAPSGSTVHSTEYGACSAGVNRRKEGLHHPPQRLLLGDQLQAAPADRALLRTAHQPPGLPRPPAV